MPILNCPTNPKGLMVIPKLLADERINNYLTEKYPILSAIIGRDEIKYIHYTVEQLSDLFNQIDSATSLEKLDGIRTYFAVYEADGKNDSNCDLLIPKGFEGNLTFVFAPTVAEKDDHVDTKNYYYMDPLGGSVVKLSAETAAKWVNCYKYNRLNKLSEALGRGDTNSVWLEKDVVIDYICYTRLKKPTGLFFNLAAYNKDEVLEPSKAFVGSQLTLTFKLSYETTFSASANKSADLLAINFNEPSAEGEGDDNGEDDGDDSDTVNPCPPAVCRGSSL